MIHTRSMITRCESVGCSVVSASLQPHGLQPAWFHCPWNPPGKNTAVSRHALFQGNLSDLRIEPCFPAPAADSLLTEPPEYE